MSNAATLPDARIMAIDNLSKKFSYLDTLVNDGKFVAGDQFTAADAYLFTVLRWTDLFQIDLSRWPALAAYRKRVGNEQGVQAALAEEDLSR